MKEELKIFIETKSFIELVSQYSILFPKRSVVFKNRFMDTSFSLLEELYLFNYRKKNMEILFMKISLLDYYIEYGYKNRFFSHKINKELSNKLSLILRLCYGLKRKYSA